MIPNPKQAADQAAALIKILNKSGKAIVTVTRVPHADDHSFLKAPPSCCVTVTVTDPEADAKLVFEDSADLFTSKPPHNTHEFTIPVEAAVKRWLNFVRRKKRRCLNVKIEVKPINGFESCYDPPIAQSMTLKSAAHKTLTVSLKPKANVVRELSTTAKRRRAKGEQDHVSPEIPVRHQE